MFEQKTEIRNEVGPLLAAYATRQAEMDRLYDGEVLRDAVIEVLKRLPSGPLTLVSTSVQGAGLVAACAAARAEPTGWRQVNLAHSTIEVSGAVVVVEPVDAGAGWRAAVAARYPGAQILVGTGEPALALAA